MSDDEIIDRCYYHGIIVLLAIKLYVEYVVRGNPVLDEIPECFINENS